MPELTKYPAEKLKEKCETCAFEYRSREYRGECHGVPAHEDVGGCRADDMNDEEMRAEGLDPWAWDDTDDHLYGVEIPCPYWRLKTCDCPKHGHFDGMAECPKCDEEMERELDRIHAEADKIRDEVDWEPGEQ